MAEIPKDSGSALNMNPLVRMTSDEALHKINLLEANIKALDIQLKQVTEERNQANSVLHAQVRASFLNKARGLTQIPETQLHKRPPKTKQPKKQSQAQAPSQTTMSKLKSNGLEHSAKLTVKEKRSIIGTRDSWNSHIT